MQLGGFDVSACGVGGGAKPRKGRGFNKDTAQAIDVRPKSAKIIFLGGDFEQQ